MTGISPREYFNLIDKAVEQQIKRLLIPEGGSKRDKGQQILRALDRLFLAVTKKYPQEDVKIRSRITPLVQIDSKEIDKLDLTTIDSMLDVQIRMWESEIPPWTEQGQDFNGRREGYRQQISLRRALNIARNNFFNFGTWGPLWGKANALKQVEQELGLDKP